MTRWRQLKRNLGRWGTAQLVFVTALMAFICVMLATVGHLLPLVAFLTPVAAVTAGREALVRNLDATVSALKWGWGGLMVFALGAGFLRDAVELTEAQDAMVLIPLLVCVGAYVSAAFWVWSDPEVFRLE